MAGLGVRGSYVCVPWLINSLCTPPFPFAKSSEITCQDTDVRRRGVRRRKFLCSSSPSPASCVRECERVPGRSQQLVSRARLGRQEIRSPRRRCVGGGRHEPAFMAAAGASRSSPAA